MARSVTLADIRRARETQAPTIRRTPVVPFSRDWSEVGHERLFLKAENLQVTGSYKPRGAFSVMNSLSAGERAKGVVLTSSGNFGQAFAYAGACMGTAIAVLVLDRASPAKVVAMQGYGAEVLFSGTDPIALQPAVVELARERGMTAIDVFEHPAIMTGQATVGIEILEDLPDVELVLMPVSSGSSAAGVAMAMKEARSNVKVFGVQPEKANAAYVSLRRGEAITIDYWDTMADALAAVRPGLFPFDYLQKYLDGIVLVSEQEIAAAFRALLFRAKLLAEPAGAVASAAFLSGKVEADGRIVALVSGGNVSEAVVHKMLAVSAPAGER